jgi:hypothetical protein
LNSPPLIESLNRALDATIQNLFNNLISNIVAPTFSHDKSTPISRFEHGFKIALDAYDQALHVIETVLPSNPKGPNP